MRYLKAFGFAAFWTTLVIGGGYWFVILCEYLAVTFSPAQFTGGAFALLIFGVIFGARLSPDKYSHRPPLR